ncbi:MAG: hypothetical protein KGR98_11025, partial [Verrucomicrobia bacterium]|nr:hypothetical protein [Verrucomicrobiota bacterium]
WCQLPNRPQFGNTVFESVALAMAKNSPEEAAAWLKSLPPAADRNYALTTLAADWARSDPRASLEWTMQLSDADGRRDAVQRAFTQWSLDDTAASAQWLGAHLSDPAADQMVIGLVDESGISASDPRDAIAWADLIAEPRARVDSIEDTFIGWARQQPDAAVNCIRNDTVLTPGEKNQILSSFTGWKNVGAN